VRDTHPLVVPSRTLAEELPEAVIMDVARSVTVCFRSLASG
jgi:hypothetical protein